MSVIYFNIKCTAGSCPTTCMLVALTALAGDQKLKPMIIFKNLVHIPKGTFPAGVHVTVS